MCAPLRRYVCAFACVRVCVCVCVWTNDTGLRTTTGVCVCVCVCVRQVQDRATMCVYVRMCINSYIYYVFIYYAFLERTHRENVGQSNQDARISPQNPQNQLQNCQRISLQNLCSAHPRILINCLGPPHQKRH